MSIVANDNFTIGTNTLLENLSVDPPNRSHTWTKTAGTSLTAIAADDFTDNQANVSYLNDYTPGNANYQVSIDVYNIQASPRASYYCGISARWDGGDNTNSNCYMIVIEGDGDWWLERVVNSSATHMQQGSGLTVNGQTWTTLTLKLVTNGSGNPELTATWGGASIITDYEDTNAAKITATGQGGFGTYPRNLGNNTDWKWDNFAIDDLSAGGLSIPVAMQYYQRLRG